jgi:hypothetical protein
MVLCEAYGMTKDPLLRQPAQKGIDFILKNMGKSNVSVKDLASMQDRFNKIMQQMQSEKDPAKRMSLQRELLDLRRQMGSQNEVEGGFGYTGPGNDVHVTSFQVMALKSARLAGLTVPEEAFAKLRGYYDNALAPNYLTNYRSGPGNGSTPARAALGLFCRFFLGVGAKDPKLAKIADVIAKTGPVIDDVFQVYYGSYGMFQMGGEYWKNWNAAFRDAVVALQVKDPEDLRGSWNATGRSSGRVVATAIYIMALEVYYRFLPVNR